MTLDRLLNLWCTSPLQTSSQCPCNWQSSGFKSVLFVDTEILTLWRRAVKKASKTETTCLRVCVSSSPKEKKRGLDGNGITWKSPSLVWLLQLVYWILLISHLHGNSIYSFTSVQRSGISRGNWSKSTEEKRSVMPSPSATLTTQPSLWEKATGGLRATKLHSEGGWGEVRVEGIGEHCCVGSGWSLERLSIPQLLLAFSGMTRECEWGDTGEEESDQNHPKISNQSWRWAQYRSRLLWQQRGYGDTSFPRPLWHQSDRTLKHKTHLWKTERRPWRANRAWSRCHLNNFHCPRQQLNNLWLWWGGAHRSTWTHQWVPECCWGGSAGSEHWESRHVNFD